MPAAARLAADLTNGDVMHTIRHKHRPAAVAGTAALLTGALAAGLLVAATPAAEATSTDTAAVTARAADAGTESRIDDAVAALDTLADDLLAKTHIPGMAVAVVHGGRTVYAKGFGVRKAGGSAKVDPNTVFQLASLSKPVGSTVVAHQVGEKVVTWTTPVRKNLPWFRLASKYVTKHVTIGDLYSHRSGLPDHAGDLAEGAGYHRKQVLKRLRNFPLDAFRDSYAYTNFGLTAAAQSVAKASGKSWARLSEDLLYRPLGMTSTSSRFSDFKASKERAYGHVEIDGRWVAKYVRQPDAQAPAGGVSSSVNDMSKWLKMLLANGKYDGRTIVEPSALLPAVSPQSVSNPPSSFGATASFYGFGFNVGKDDQGNLTLSHSGAFSLGAATSFTAIPALDLAIVTLTNASAIGVPETLNAEFMDLARFGSQQRDWWTLYHGAFVAMNAPQGALVGRTPPADPRPARAARAYLGTYANSTFGKVRVRKGKTGLEVVIGPARLTWPLQHWNGDLFAVRPTGEDANPGSVSKVRFRGFHAGTATAVRIEYYDEGGLGTFRR